MSIMETRVLKSCGNHGSSIEKHGKIIWTMRLPRRKLKISIIFSWGKSWNIISIWKKKPLPGIVWIPSLLVDRWSSKTEPHVPNHLAQKRSLIFQTWAFHASFQKFWVECDQFGSQHVTVSTFHGYCMALSKLFVWLGGIGNRCRHPVPPNCCI